MPIDSSATGAPVPMPRAFHVALWTAQIALAVFFAYAGLSKITQPIADLAGAFGWPADLPPALVRSIGFVELSGAVGLILPAAPRFKPGLSSLAGVGLAAVMVFAAVFHMARGELFALPTNIALAALAAFVAWGRLKVSPIEPKK